MRKILIPQHRSTFYKQGYITFDDLLTADDITFLRTIELKPAQPRLLKIIKKKQLAEIAYELIDKQPLRIASLAYTTQALLKEGDCALLIDLATAQVTYTQLPEFTLEAIEALLIILTARYLDIEKHPIVFRAHSS